jgi:hypothetical protein
MAKWRGRLSRVDTRSLQLFHHLLTAFGPWFMTVEYDDIAKLAVERTAA